VFGRTDISLQLSTLSIHFCTFGGIMFGLLSCTVQLKGAPQGGYLDKKAFEVFLK
jgi:hypothetical protein